MSKYSQEVIDEFVKQVDGLDLLELIDYHPESIQRHGDIVECFCPLSQDMSGRYLRIDLKKGTFESKPPLMPEQRGNLVDLFARCRRVSVEEAMEQLAEEFGIYLVESKSEDALGSVLAEATEQLTIAAAAPNNSFERGEALKEAEKRLRRLQELKPNDETILKALFELRFLQGNALLLKPITLKLTAKTASKEDLVAAIDFARRHLELANNDLQIRSTLADLHVLNDNTQEAISELMILADIAEGLNNVQTAVEAYRRVDAIGDDSIDVLPMIVSSLTAKGMVEEAEAEIDRRVTKLIEAKKYYEAFQTAALRLEINPDNHDVRIQMVDLLTEAGLTEDRIESALGYIRQMEEMDAPDRAAEALGILSAGLPDNRKVTAELVRVYREMGEVEVTRELTVRLAQQAITEKDFDEANLQLGMVLAESPEHVPALLAMGDLLHATGDTEEALLQYAAASSIQQERGEYEEVAGILDRALAIAPERASLHEEKIELLLGIGQQESAKKAFAVYTELLETKADEAALYRVMERFLHRLSPDASSVRRLSGIQRKLGKVEAGDQLLINLVSRLISEGKFAEAEKEARSILEEQPDNPRLRELLAATLVSAQKNKEALALYRELAEEYRLGDNLDQARRILDRITTLDTTDEGALAALLAVCSGLGDAEGVADAGMKLIALSAQKDDFEAIEETAKEILNLIPNHFEARRALITALEKTAKESDAQKERLLFAAQLRKAGDAAAELLILRDYTTGVDPEPAALERYLELSIRKDGAPSLAPAVALWVKRSTETLDRKIKFLRSLCDAAPVRVELREPLARLYREAGRSEEMVAEMQSVIEQYEAAGKVDQAIGLYEEILEEAPDSISTRAGMIELLRTQNRLDEAITQYLVLARWLVRLGKPEDACLAYEEMYSILPENEEIYRAHAALLRDLDRGGEANNKLRELAGIFAKQKKTEKAFAVLTQLLEEEPSNHGLRRELIELRRDAGHKQQAVDEISKLCSLLLDEGDEAGAIAARREAIGILPDSVEQRQLLIKQLEDANRLTEARNERIALAAAQANKSDYQKALALLEALLRDEPGNITARRERARIFDLMGDEKRALAEYRELQLHLDQFSLDVPAKASSAQEDSIYPELEILEDYDFDSFIVGSKNNFAFATAKSVAEHPGSARNPLFLYSDVGLGKTHLLHAIANYLKKKKPGIRILYTSTEYFTSELIDAIQNNTVTAFRNRHQQADVLLLDDVQFLAGKERAQEEFFHIFNMLYQRQRQIVVTSDRPPKDIDHLNMRLRSRFGQGVIVDIQKPDVETRMAILRAENERRKSNIPDEVLAVLADRVTSSVRELKGALIQLLTVNEIGGEALSIELANDVVEKFYTTG